MNEESGELPVNKDPALLRQMLKKVSGKNHKLKEELAILQETIQSHENSLLLKEETINKSNEKTQELENTIKEREKEIQNQKEEIENLKQQKDDEINNLRQQIEQNLQNNREYSREFELEARMKTFEQEKLKFEIEKKSFQIQIQKQKENGQNENNQENVNYTEKEQMLRDQFELLATEQNKIDLQKKVLEEMKQQMMEEVIKLENMKTDFEIEKASVQLKLDEIQKLTSKNDQILHETKEERIKIENKQKELQEETEKLTQFRDTMSEKIKEFEEREKKLVDLEEIKQKAEDQLKSCLERENIANQSKIKYEAQQNDLDRLQATLSAKLKLCDATNEEAQKKMDQLLMREEQLDAKVSRMRENADKSRKDAEQTIQNLRNQIDDASRKARIEADKANDLENQLEQINSLYKELNDENSNLKKEIDRLSSAAEAANELESLRKEVNKYKEMENEFNKTKEELKQKNDDLSIQEAKNESLEKKLQAEIKRYDDSTRGHIDGTDASYLKKTILQFFLIKDNHKREEMVPIILTILRCDDKQISSSIKSWKESQQLINSHFWPLK